MSDKAQESLNPLDRVIRRAVDGPGPEHEGVLLTIEFVGGFEKFNTRPYHNYETWGAGYRVKGQGFEAEAEDLDDAVRLWAEAKASALRSEAA
jgi:hypothetical protein